MDLGLYVLGLIVSLAVVALISTRFDGREQKALGAIFLAVGLAQVIGTSFFEGSFLWWDRWQWGGIIIAAGVGWLTPLIFGYVRGWRKARSERPVDNRDKPGAFALPSVKFPSVRFPSASRLVPRVTSRSDADPILDLDLLDQYQEGNIPEVILPLALFEHAQKRDIPEDERTKTLWMAFGATTANARPIHQAGMGKFANHMFAPATRRSTTR